MKSSLVPSMHSVIWSSLRCLFTCSTSLESLPDGADRTEQMGFNRSHLQRSHRGDFFQAHLLDKAQDEDGPLLGRELFNCGPDRGHLLLSKEDPLLGSMGVRQSLPELRNILEW